MSGDDLVAQAAAELYAADPGEFISRRAALAAAARKAGAPAAAKRIAGLRKPTRSAWVVNQLARADPAAAGRLSELGEQLRAAQDALDGDALRELSVRRRQLIDGLARAAFAAAGLAMPPAALREEVTGTLGAALADPEVAAQLRAGTLDRPARREGFGAQAPPVLTLVPAGRRSGAAARPAPSGPGGRPSGPGRGADAGSRRGRGDGRDRGDGRERGTGPERAAGREQEPGGTVTTLAQARARAERERRRQAAEAAQRRLAEADAEAAEAAAEQQQAEHAVRVLEVQLADVRQRLSGAQETLSQARARFRQAAAAQRRARLAVDRLPP